MGGVSEPSSAQHFDGELQSGLLDFLCRHKNQADHLHEGEQCEGQWHAVGPRTCAVLEIFWQKTGQYVSQMHSIVAPGVVSQKLLRHRIPNCQFAHFMALEILLSFSLDIVRHFARMPWLLKHEESFLPPHIYEKHMDMQEERIR